MPILSYLIYVRFSYYVFGTSNYSCPAQLVNRYTVGERSGARSITQTCPFLRGFVAGQYNERIEIPSLVISTIRSHMLRDVQHNSREEHGSRQLATRDHLCLRYSIRATATPSRKHLTCLQFLGPVTLRAIVLSRASAIQPARCLTEILVFPTRYKVNSNVQQIPSPPPADEDC